jgi:FRG domain
MQVKDLNSWEELLDAVESLRDIRRTTSQHYQVPTSPLLYRGQADHEWKLESTLERRVTFPHSFSSYFRVISMVKPQIEAFTANRWNLSPLPTLHRWADKYDNLKLKDFPGYEFMIYLRHHGFPSPLLDWSRSLYVAAYFAFSRVAAGRAAIFMYWEDTGVGKASSSNSPQIKSFGPYVRAHHRHFNQQSVYTISASFETGEWQYTPYEQSPMSYELTLQDKLYKFTLPTKERPRVLAILDSMNVNAFSLFGSEDALAETLALRELDLKGHEL